jgi:hypothetical protein
VSVVVERRCLQRKRIGFFVVVAAVFVDDRGAYFKGRIREAPISKGQLRLFRLGDITAQVDEEKAVAASGRQKVVIELEKPPGTGEDLT